MNDLWAYVLVDDRNDATLAVVQTAPDAPVVPLIAASEADAARQQGLAVQAAQRAGRRLALRHYQHAVADQRWLDVPSA